MSIVQTARVNNCGVNNDIIQNHITHGKIFWNELVLLTIAPMNELKNILKKKENVQSLYFYF